ncbi:MAG: TetR/AcrR family transcriptional regulator [Xanthomonadales bacterium]|nr:TetR/AcrR family transcriptional regulator [Xanthomonadales bacterium]
MARRDTRGLILKTSLALFNDLGEPNVTTNLIADEAEISPGNLYYHFRQKKDIVEALFSAFAESLLPLIDIDVDDDIDAESLWFRLHLVFELKGQYRFVYRNLSDIAGRMPDVDNAMRALLGRERRAVANLLEGLCKSGQMKADWLQRSMLLDQIMLTMTYWIPHADQFDPDGTADGSAQVRAISRVFLLVSPYLQPPWQDETRRLAADYLQSLEQ